MEFKGRKRFDNDELIRLPRKGWGWMHGKKMELELGRTGDSASFVPGCGNGGNSSGHPPNCTWYNWQRRNCPKSQRCRMSGTILPCFGADSLRRQTWRISLRNKGLNDNPSKQKSRWHNCWQNMDKVLLVESLSSLIENESASVDCFELATIIMRRFCSEIREFSSGIR